MIKNPYDIPLYWIANDGILIIGNLNLGYFRGGVGNYPTQRATVLRFA